MREQTHINIQEPPVIEFKKQRSCIKRSCFSGCGCIGIFFFSLLLLLNVLTGSGSKQVKTLPDTFPSDIELYDTERIDTISVSDTPAHGSIAQIASIFPKALLASTYLALGDNTPSTVSSYYDGVTLESESWFKRFWTLMDVPLTPDTAQIEITWTNLPAEPKFIQEFYTTAFTSASYTIHSTANTQSRRQLLFEKDDYIGALLIRDATPDTKGTDFIQFTISLPYSSL